MKKTYSITIILKDPDLTEKQADRLFRAGADDATPGVSCGQAYVDFDREAASLADAIQSALSHLADAGLRPARIEPDELVTQSEIAERCGLSRQSISNYVREKRGAGGFPAPAAKTKSSSPLWKFSEVTTWLFSHGRIGRAIVQEAEALERFNRQLASRTR